MWLIDGNTTTALGFFTYTFMGSGSRGGVFSEFDSILLGKYFAFSRLGCDATSTLLRTVSTPCASRFPYMQCSGMLLRPLRVFVARYSTKSSSTPQHSLPSVVSCPRHRDEGDRCSYLSNPPLPLGSRCPFNIPPVSIPRLNRTKAIDFASRFYRFQLSFLFSVPSFRFVASSDICSGVFVASQGRGVGVGFEESQLRVMS